MARIPRRTPMLPINVLRRPGEAARAASHPSEPTPSSVVAWGWYRHGVRENCEDLDLATSRALAGDGFVWLGLHDPTNADMSHFARSFGLHRLAIEDAVEGHTRSKLERFGDTLFLVASTVGYVEHDTLTATSEVVRTGQVMVFVGDNFVLTVRRGPNNELGGLRQRLEADPNRLAAGPFAVLYGILDTVVDIYTEVVHQIEDDIDAIEEAVFSPDSGNDINRVFRLKRELIEFKRAVGPLGLPLQHLATKEDLAPEHFRAYFREIADHHIEARESVNSFDEVLTSILQFAQAQVTLRDNSDMRKISAAVGMVAVPTMIAGIYGMNFENMPELTWRYGYFICLAVMALSVLGLYLSFKKRNWL